MSFINVNEIKIYENQVKEHDILKQIIATRDQEDAFYILDLGDVIKKHRNWLKKMPRVVPHFAVKCNPDPMVIKILAAMNASFDCASQQEIEQVMQYGVTPDKIIFANPTKSPSHIKFAKSVGVDKMTVDNELELFKIKNLFPEAKIIIRFRCDGNSNHPRFISLGVKFGCDPGDEANKLIQFSKNLGLTLHGFSFHVGSSCYDFKAYACGIEICKKLITFAKSIGCKDIKLVDIGGGFPGEIEFQIDELSHIINDAIEEIDPNIQVISEPGRYYVASAFTLASYLHSKKTMLEEKGLRHAYYVNCGVYTGFIEELLNLNSRHPISLFNQPVSDKKYSSTLWGQTCDSYDCIIKDGLLPEFQIGDWLVWSNMGAYTISLSSTFNGFMLPQVHPFIRKSQWQDFCAIIRCDVNN
ncbi:PREDICTED: antizyme inhibitor 2-like isoform X1 [Polistes canadensis]|uniref:antizyme inhibitor 2-like isoform X1 n=1 Tax=Polistes canadensis TaxID=91411 RepID=UPI000718C617|nr:PREDICTED: antizyme inhibitor 2-like isoform X1 [Polistes canadensis]